MTLAKEGKIHHSIRRIRFEDINENLELLRDGDIIGRAVISYGAGGGRSPGKSVPAATAR